MFQPGDKVKVVKINDINESLSSLIGETGTVVHSLGHGQNTIYAVQIDGLTGDERHFWPSELEPVPKTKLAVIAIKDNLILSTNVFDDETKAKNHFFQKCEEANPQEWKRVENEKERLALLARRHKRPYQTHADGQFGGLSCIDVYLTDINE